MPYTLTTFEKFSHDVDKALTESVAAHERARKNLANSDPTPDVPRVSDVYYWDGEVAVWKTVQRMCTLYSEAQARRQAEGVACLTEINKQKARFEEELAIYSREKRYDRAWEVQATLKGIEIAMSYLPTEAPEPDETLKELRQDITEWAAESQKFEKEAADHGDWGQAEVHATYRAAFTDVLRRIDELSV